MDVFKSIFIFGFYLLGIVWAPLYAWFWRREYLLAAFLVALNVYLGFDWFGFFSDLPPSENGTVVVGLIFIFPPYVTVMDIFAMLAFYMFKHGGLFFQSKTQKYRHRQ